MVKRKCRQPSRRQNPPSKALEGSFCIAAYGPPDWKHANSQYSPPTQSPSAHRWKCLRHSSCALLYPPVQRHPHPRQLCNGVSGDSSARRNAASRPAESSPPTAQPNLQRPASRLRHLGRHSWHPARRSGPVRSSARPPMALLRLRTDRASPSLSHPSRPLRPANYTGAIGAPLLIALLATSNDISLRRLGAGSWKSLQRWNYAVFALGGDSRHRLSGHRKTKAALRSDRLGLHRDHGSNPICRMDQAAFCSTQDGRAEERCERLSPRVQPDKPVRLFIPHNQLLRSRDRRLAVGAERTMPAIM